MDKERIIWIVISIAMIAFVATGFILGWGGESYEDKLYKADKTKHNNCIDDYETTYEDCIRREKAKQYYG